MLPVPSLVPTALRCESLTDPLGIGRERPALSWKLQPAADSLKNLRQSAYQIRVASSPSLLAHGMGDLWDSGRVASSAQYGVQYGGKPLGSSKACWWTLRAWDGNGAPSKWSKPASFSTGLLKESDWQAKWIAYDVPDPKDALAFPFQGAKWIWSARDEAGKVPQGKRTFVRRFQRLSGALNVATMTLTADDQATVWVNGKEAGRTDGKTDAWRRPITVDLLPYIQDGENEIRIEAENAEGGAAGLIGKVSMLGPFRSTSFVTDAGWVESGRPAAILGAYGAEPWGRFGEGKVLRPATSYRRSFTARKTIRRATATVTALGLVDLYVNEKRVTEDLFTPGWTDYHKRVYARTFDVTRLLRVAPSKSKKTPFEEAAEGLVNQVRLEVGDGWYSGYVGFGAQRSHYGERPRVRAQIDLEFTDGTRQTIGTDEKWTAYAADTVVQDFLAGEEYVARRPGYHIDDRGYRPTVVRDVKAKVEPFPGVPVRSYARLKPVKITPQGDGYMLDFGQNLAGFAHLKAQGKAGQRVQMQFLEVLNPDGSPYTANLRSARAIDAYTFGTEKTEEWEPRFTFHGFRYLKVTGLGHKPKPEELTAVAISSATPETGHFACSDPMLNKLAKNAWWTQKMNFIDVPTDCPQRDERLGWTGDAQAYVRTAATYSDVQAFFGKWLVALDDDQRKDGQYPTVAPQIVSGDDGGPAWADAGVICPKTIYDVYGDKRLLAEHYPQMKRFVEFCRRRSGADLLPPRNFHAFGDWLSIQADTPNVVIYEAYFALSTKLLAQSAAELGKTEDAAEYEKLFRDIRQAFQKAYVSPEGVVRGDTQTAYVLALGFDLLDRPLATKAAARLVANIESRNWHLSTGFVGTRDLMQVLSKIGRNDVAFRLLHNTTFPSWGFEIKNGATTVWERWDGWTPEKGFQDPGMNSFAHYAYGAVMGWVFATVGGIDAAKPGFAEIDVAPKIDPRLTWAKTSYESVRGTVKTSWRVAGKKVDLTVEVPPNATARVWVPGEAGVRRVGSGIYRFSGTR